MTPSPLYHPTTELAAYQLHYAWTGWPSEKRFIQQPSQLIEATAQLWETDGLRVLEHRWTEEMVQILFSAIPDVAPTTIAARAKGRLDHALRSAGIAMPFSRKVALRSIGDNTRRDVEEYVERQVAKEEFVDPQFAAALAELTVVHAHIDLSQPVESARGRYWYNLHLVLVVEQRLRFRDLAALRQIRDDTLRIADKKGHAISRLAVLPDHLHLALRPIIDESPLDVAFAYQNNLAYLLRQGRIWRDSFYAGTFGEYTTPAVRKKRDE